MHTVLSHNVGSSVDHNLFNAELLSGQTNPHREPSVKQIPMQFDFGLITFQSAYCGLHYACGTILLKGFVEKTQQKNNKQKNLVDVPDDQSVRAAFLSRLFGTFAVVLLILFVCKMTWPLGDPCSTLQTRKQSRKQGSLFVF